MRPARNGSAPHRAVCADHLASYQGEQDVTCEREPHRVIASKVSTWHRMGSARWNEQGETKNA